jgi:hypothetical protein
MKALQMILKKLASRPNGFPKIGGHRPPLQPKILGLGVSGELAFRPRTGKADASLRPATRQDGATGLGARARQETELTDTTFLGGLERSFHGRG